MVAPTPEQIFKQLKIFLIDKVATISKKQPEGHGAEMEKQLADLFNEIFRFTGVRDQNLLVTPDETTDRADQGNVMFRVFFWIYPILLSVFPDLSTACEPLANGKLDMLGPYLNILVQLIDLPDESGPEWLEKGFLHHNPGVKEFKLEKPEEEDQKKPEKKKEK